MHTEPHRALFTLWHVFYSDDPFSHLWQLIGPELFLVPAFGKNISAHKKRAESLHRQYGAFSFVANQHPEGDKPGGSFSCTSGKHKPVNEQPTILTLKLAHPLQK